MSGAPHFSIIIPAFNRGEVVLGALESVRRQDYGARVEVVIVDDSTDDTPRIIQDYAAAHPELKIVYFHPEQRARAAGARAKALELAQGRYAIILDSDDALTDGALAWIEGMFEKHPCAVLMGGVTMKSGHAAQYDPAFLDRPLGVADTLKGFHQPEMMPTLDIAFLRRHGLSYITDLIGFEGLLYLRIARAGGVIWRATRPVRLYDDIGDTRQSTVENILKISNWMARGHGRLFDEFGDEMRRHAPALYWKTLLKAAIYARIAGERVHEAVRRHPVARLIGALPAPLVRRIAIAFK